MSGSRPFHPILAGPSIERWWGGLSGPRAGVYKANSCVIVSRAWENVPLAGRWRDLTPEPLVKKTCVLPDSIVMLMSTSTLLNLMLTFFLSLGDFFSFVVFFFFFLVTCLWENLLWGYSVKLINQAIADEYIETENRRNNQIYIYIYILYFFSYSIVIFLFLIYLFAKIYFGKIQQGSHLQSFPGLTL